MSELAHHVDLASIRLGGAVIAANDESFGSKEHLLDPLPPKSYADHIGLRGELYDGWETRRSRNPGNDWVIVRLGAPGIVREVLIDTSFFKGNCPKAISIQACGAEGYLPPEELVTRDDLEWTTLVTETPVERDSENRFLVANEHRFTHVRLNIHPDGGVARLRVLGDVVPDPRRFAGVSLDLAAQANGGVVLGCSDQFFGNPFNINAPTPMLRHEKGWESTRRRGPGHDWIELRLGGRGVVRHVEYDTTYYRGNAPESFRVLGCDAEERDLADPRAWYELLPRTSGLHDAAHWFSVPEPRPTTHVRLEIYPDGGVSRLKLIGELDALGREATTIRWLDSLPRANAIAALTSLSATTETAVELADSRKFDTAENVCAALEALPSGSSGQVAEALAVLLGRQSRCGLLPSG
ncbi:allantoicase [Saccharopolyspora kobensis]|uniref:Probable allantoicase n=1 Tax=Saccharopolyspora kobensis TaxID=146035 RepID=A0A1H5V2A1_9PSEU|nr:allantoicase [Saccharopolyspora kobensis]SEF81423.1 allantoicase [Saccharopolyspora kobensis]SFC66269.1 allantoicase [Saccharopolyspora kobensis]